MTGNRTRAMLFKTKGHFSSRLAGFTVVSSLGLGFLTNCLVAWVVCFLPNRTFVTTEGIVANAAPTWGFYRYDCTGSTTFRMASILDGGDLRQFRAMLSRNPSHGSAVTPTRVPSYVSRQSPDSVSLDGNFYLHARGWPLRSLACKIQLVRTRAQSTPLGWWSPPTVMTEAAIFLQDRAEPVPKIDWLERHVLPLRPLWFGLLVNSSLYSLLWLLLFVGVAFARQVCRKRVGRCPACGYELRMCKAPGCPECGWRRPKTEAAEAKLQK